MKPSRIIYILLILIAVAVYIKYDREMPLAVKPLAYIQQTLPEIHFKQTLQELYPLAGIKSLFNKINPFVQLTRDGIISETNKARTANGLPALFEENKLDMSAQNKAEDLLKRQYFEHISPDSKGVGDLAQAVSYSYSIIGENLALGDFTSDADVVDAWMNSPEHRANILNTKYTDIGVGVVQGLYKGEKAWILVQHFGRPLSLCPQVDGSLKAKIGTEEAQISSIEADLAKRKGDIAVMNAEEDPEYGGAVEAYNQEVNLYNSLVAEAEENISTYNNEVKSFNTCLEY